jgi:predicted phosphodiesterase
LNALLINDVHIGVNRSAGTTQESRRALKQYLQNELHSLLFRHTDKDLIVNGDLFDAFDVEIMEILWTFYTFADWLEQSKKKVFLGKGNHDISKDDQKLSAFSFMCMLLVKQFPDQVVVIEGGLQQLYEHVWMIPHCLNQQQFEEELAKASEIIPAYILLHANVDNHYAEQADHSLNVSDEWIRKLTDQGHTLVFGHEHHHKLKYGGNVIVTGNQFPSSVYDCMTQKNAQADGLKYAHWLYETKDAKGFTHVCLDKIVTWDALGTYSEVLWFNLDHADYHHQAEFVRVIGTALAEEAPNVVSAIAKFRQKSQAFVVANAVEIQGIAGMEKLSELSLEKLQKIDVLAELKKHLEPEEVVAIDELIRSRA